MKVTIFGREPAAVLAFLAILVKLFSAFVVHVNADQQSVINAALAALVGLAVAQKVHDGQAAALYGFAQALVALAVGFGLHWDPATQALVLSAIQAAIGMWTRTQVVAPVPAAVPAGVASTNVAGGDFQGKAY